MGHNTRSAPIGRLWTPILRLAVSLGAVSACDVVAMRWGSGAGTGQMYGYAASLLTRMTRSGFLAILLVAGGSPRWAALHAPTEYGIQVLDPPPRVLKTDGATLLIARDRRADLKARGVCINNAAHGPATSGVLCAACRETHKRTA